MQRWSVKIRRTKKKLNREGMPLEEETRFMRMRKDNLRSRLNEGYSQKMVRIWSKFSDYFFTIYFE